MKISRPSPSLLVAVLALCLATGGVGYAAGSLPHHSVGRAQLKKNAVTTKSIKNGAVTGQKVGPDSLTGAQIDESTLSLPRQPGTVVLTPDRFVPWDSSYTYANPNGTGLRATGPSPSVFQATAQLPVGARVTLVKVFVYDIGGGTVSAFAGPADPSSATGGLSQTNASTSAASGDQILSLTPPYTADATSVLSVVVELPSSPFYLLYGAEIHYT